MTAATMAHQLNSPRARGRLRGFVDEVANLVRSQVAAITGNLLLVVPAALLLQAALLLAGFGHLPDPAHAENYIQSLSILERGAVLCGVYRRAAMAVGSDRWLVRKLGHVPPVAGGDRTSAPDRRAAGTGARGTGGRVIEDNVAALGGNVSLGILLGMEPVIAAFFGLPLEVRHVTLSTGQLALASWSHGAGIFSTPSFWWAVVGIGAIGFMNLSVSFGLALIVAIRSTGRGAVSRRRL